MAKGHPEPRLSGGTIMNIQGRTILITGSNRGIGKALVDEALRRGAALVYAGTRGSLVHDDSRVVPVALDVTDRDQIAAAAQQIGELDVLINNAGIALFDDLSDRAVLEQHLAVNLFGPYEVTQALLAALARSHGSIVNNASMMALAPFPVTPAYAISKAAEFNFTQSLRAIVKARGISVHAVLTGPTDTDMTRGYEIPKASPESVARAIFDGLERGDEEIFPDPMSEAMAESWNSGAAKAFEHQFAAVLQAA
jgi:NAD(P)-dependent dehydrogenase (short-subunit alcohol dehydrogenase family)